MKKININTVKMAFLSSFTFILLFFSVLPVMAQTGISNPIASKSLVEFLSKALAALVKILIPFIVVYFVVIGLMFISAQGKPEKIDTAKKALLGGVIGSAIVLGAWVVTQMLVDTLKLISG